MFISTPGLFLMGSEPYAPPRFMPTVVVSNTARVEKPAGSALAENKGQKQRPTLEEAYKMA